MSVHLNTLLLPVGVVWLTWTPVSVCHRGGVHPPVQVNQRNTLQRETPLWSRICIVLLQRNTDLSKHRGAN